MGFVGSLFSDDKGSGYQAQKLAPEELQGASIAAPATQGQVNQLYDQSQGGIQQQQAFLNALSAQNGIGNQSNVFAQQQALANQLGDQAQGAGPNPALAMLNQTTGQNVANQQALMASQRGANANAGLIARQAAQQGAATQQNAVGQAALMRAQQQLSAQQQLQQQQALMGSLAGQQIGQQAGATSGYNQMLQNQYGLTADQLSKQNAQNIAMKSNLNNNAIAQQSNINNANAGIAGINAQGQQQMFGGVMNGAAMALMHDGGMVKRYADGGEVYSSEIDKNFSGDEPQSFAAKFLKGASSQPTLQQGSQNMGKAMGQGMSNMFKSSPSTPMSDAGYSMPQMGSQFSGAAPSLGMGSSMPMGAAMMKSGGKVPGRADVKGDSLKNDKVPAVLSPGEVVIPRSVMQSKDPAKSAAKFIQALLAKQNMGKKQ